MYVMFTSLKICSAKNKLCASQARSLCHAECLYQHHCGFYTHIKTEIHLIPNNVSTDANPTDINLSHGKGKGSVYHRTGHEGPEGE
jgi:hypothetical protein